MPSEPPSPTERHHAPAVWLVLLALVAVTLLAVTVSAEAATGLLAVTLLAAAVSRLVCRGRRPEGIAVRSTGWDVTTLLALAVAIAALTGVPGV